MPRIQGLAESGLLTQGKLLKTGKGYVFSITIAWTGGTAGQQINLRDGTAVTDAAEVVFVIDAAAGTITKEWPQGKEFETGIYYDEGGVTNAFTEITFK